MQRGEAAQDKGAGRAAPCGRPRGLCSRDLARDMEHGAPDADATQTRLCREGRCAGDRGVARGLPCPGRVAPARGRRGWPPCRPAGGCSSRLRGKPAPGAPRVRRGLGAHSQRRVGMGLGAGPSRLPRTSERQARLNLNFWAEPLSGLLSPHVSGPRPPPYIPVLYAWPTCTLKADPDLRQNVARRASRCSFPPRPRPNPNPPVFLSQRRANYSLNGQGPKLGVFFDSSLSFPPPRSPTCKHC